MANKIYDKIKTFIKNNYKFLIFYVFLVFLFTYRLDYEIYTPGGISDLDDRIEIEGEYKSEGSFNLTYVNAKKGIIPFVLLSKIIPSWDLIDLDDERIENEDYESILARGKIDLENGNEIAIKIAFDEANEKYEITKNDLVVYYIFEDAKTNLKVGDIIESVNDIKITSFEELTNQINNYNVGDEIVFNVINNGKKKTRTGIVYESEGKKIIGMILVNSIKVETDKNIEFKYSSNESGSSGGLMSTLEIYDSLIEEDITKGLKIAGTGTINYDGTVGEIGGVKYKLAGAVKKKADIFLVPSNNYQEALELKEKYNYDIKIIEAKDFKSVLKSLEEL